MATGSFVTQNYSRSQSEVPRDLHKTVKGRLLEIGLRGCKARPKSLLTVFQRKRRLTWAREHSLWTIKDWEKVIFSDKSQFCISGNQSSAYVRRRTHEEFSPQCLKPTVKYPTKVMVWGCMSSHGVGRLHIVSGTVKAMDYIEILQNKLLPTARDLLGNQSWIFEDDNAPCHRAKFQQDGATCHTARALIDLLKDTLGDRLISRFGPVNWPPRSCDLTPLDYFLCGYVKSLVYADKSQTLDYLEDNIRRVIADIRPQMLEKVIENWTSRLDYIRASHGSHMPEIIFKM
ncbi:transposable element Tcb1 transposase [Trichonephila clavipes]|nr:transposable element Tcb1 transposase [Trichonephila clavipes]